MLIQNIFICVLPVFEDTNCHTYTKYQVQYHSNIK
jgi:hypothetical protein